MSRTPVVVERNVVVRVADNAYRIITQRCRARLERVAGRLMCISRLLLQLSGSSTITWVSTPT